MKRAIDRPSTMESTRSARRTLPRLALGTAATVQVVLLPVTLGTVAVLREYYDISASSWAVLTSVATWILAVIALIVAAPRRPLATPLIPVANAALLAGIVTFGVDVLGWHA